ncbi:DUF1302 domain-containing protein [Pseudomonas sp. SH1-B]
MKKTKSRFPLLRLKVAISLASVMAMPAFGVNFKIGEIDGSFDSTVTLGSSWATSDSDKKLIGDVNGGRGQASVGDDGRLNFKNGETVSKIFKGLHDLELKYGDGGVFIRGKYWYDFELKDESRQFKDIYDHNRKEGAQSSGGQILDAFAYKNYFIGDLPGTVRLGRQVVSWGESTFIQGGINSINPIDVSAFRRPGAEIKEGLIPVNMFYVSQSLAENLTAEAFYQLEWDQTVVDNCGTFFSSIDVVADGCDNNYAVGSPAIAPLEPIAAAAGAGFDISSEGVVIKRDGDRDARDSGQFGIALRWMLDNTELGAYFINNHSNIPNFSTRTASASVHASLPGIIGNAEAIAPGSGIGLAQSTVLGNSSYFLEYPEDIQLYGLSFSTSLPTGTAWTGELSYRPNMPVQLNGPDLTYALVNHIAGGAVSPIQSSPGSENRGYRRKEFTQIQSTLTHFFDQALMADRIILVGELGATFISGMSSASPTSLNYGRDPVYGSYSINGDKHGFYTSQSWGYRVRTIFDYNDVFAGVNLKPNISWTHDVDGYSPGFNEGSKAISIGVDADYRNTYTTGISYTNFFGGDYNTLVDRDFIAVSFGITF